MSDAAVRQIGHVGRAHGVRGELAVELITDRAERLAVGARVRVGDDWKTIRSSRSTAKHWLVAFEGIDDRTAAERFAHRLLYAVADQGGDDDAVWVHDLIGCAVVDQYGTDRGSVTAVVDNPAGYLLELDSGALVPMRFINEHHAGRIAVDTPDGLFDL
ncbi:MAG TPA: ribosome maturation factor RimM [Ilumatobacteraceae bacterium]|nr:ribosome maturation factor RimM [Ilumatobacteraceae bacterium]